MILACFNIPVTNADHAAAVRLAFEGTYESGVLSRGTYLHSNGSALLFQTRIGARLSKTVQARRLANNLGGSVVFLEGSSL